MIKISITGNPGEIAKVSFTIALSVMLFTTLLMLGVLINKTKEIRKVRKNQMIVEEIRNKSKFSSLIHWNNKYLSQKDGEIVLGEAMGKIVSFNLNSFSHAMIAGQAGSGKSWILQGCVGQMAQKGAIIKMFDFKGGVEFGLECERFGEVITERPRAIEVLKELVEENKKRLSVFQKMGVKNIVEYNQRIDKSLARIIVACDEVAEMLDKTGLPNEVKVQSDEIQEYLSTLASCSKVTGINLLLGTQRPNASVINGQIKNNLPIRICGWFSDRARSEFVLGNSAATTLEGKGRFLFWKRDELLEFQAFYYGYEEVINTRVNEKPGIMLIHSEDGKENNMSSFEFPNEVFHPGERRAEPMPKL